MDRFERIRGRLLELARDGGDIEAILEIGSQARERELADEFSDLDLIIATSEPGLYLSDGGMPDRLGEVLITFTEPTLAGATERRVLFEGSLDVDMVIVTPEQLKGAIESGQLGGIISRGSRVLFDRMGLDLPMPVTEKGAMMSLWEYTNTVNDFWFHIVWAAKKLRRGELYTAVMSVNGYLQRLLLPMIELYCKCRHGGAYDVWHKGRMLELWAGEDVTAGLEGCFARYDAGDAARALHALVELYSRLARASAGAMVYPYPERAEESARRILEELLAK